MNADHGTDTARSCLPHCCAVEIPGVVNNIDAAIGSVGGLATLREVMMNEDSSLRLRLSGSYQFQAPLPMQRRRTSDLLVKASRQSDGSWRYKVIAVVNIGFTTEVLADFIFTPGPRFSYGASAVIGSIEEELTGAQADKDAIPFIPPPFFSRVNVPQPYEFEDNSFVHRNKKSKGVMEAPGTGEVKLRGSWVEVHVMKFRQGEAPSSPPSGAEDQLRGRDITLVEYLRKIFADRPVWLKSALEEKLLPEVYNVTSYQKGLQCVAYYWSDGPWRSAYIRLGWDPRHHDHAQEAKWLQVIDFRDRFFRQHRAIREDVVTPPSGCGDCHFLTPPANRSQLYQFIDIEDDGIRQIIMESETTDECTEKSGWLQQITLDHARDRMAVKSELMRRTTLLGSHLALEAPLPTQALSLGNDTTNVSMNTTTENLARPRRHSEGLDNNKSTEATGSDCEMPAAKAVKAKCNSSSLKDTGGLEHGLNVLTSEYAKVSSPTSSAQNKRRKDGSSKPPSVPELDRRLDGHELLPQTDPLPSTALEQEVCTDASTIRLRRGNFRRSRNGSLGLALAPHRLGWNISEVLSQPGQPEVCIDDLLLAINGEILISGDGIEGIEQIHEELKSKMKVALASAKGRISFVAVHRNALDDDSICKQKLRLEVLKQLDGIKGKRVARRGRPKVVQDGESLLQQKTPDASAEMLAPSQSPDYKRLRRSASVEEEALPTTVEQHVRTDSGTAEKRVARRVRRKIVQDGDSD